MRPANDAFLATSASRPGVAPGGFEELVRRTDRDQGLARGVVVVDDAADSTVVVSQTGPVAIAAVRRRRDV